MLRALLLLACTLVAVLATRALRAAEIVVVAAPDGSSSIAQRASEELTHLGFEVIETEIAESDDAAKVLEGHGKASALVLVRPSVPAVDVFLVEPTKGPILRESITGKKGNDADLALRAVEVVRAALLPSAPPKKIDPPSVAPKPTAPLPKAEPAPEPKRELVEVAIGAAVLPPAGRAPVGSAFARASLRVAGRAFVDLLGTLPLASDTVREPEGEATLRAGLAGARLRYGGSSSRLRVFGGLLLGVTLLRVVGDATPSYEARSETVVLPTALATFTTRLVLVGPLSAFADVGAGVAARAAVVRFADRDVARFGPHVFFGALGLSLGF